MSAQQSRALPQEMIAGFALMGAALLAMALINSPLAGGYERFLELPLSVQAGAFGLTKPLVLWVNEGLMAVFFFLVGLEIKREMIEGELSSPVRMLLPALAALGGMAAPSAIYALVNHGDPVALRGWAIPAATDIAFALGVLALLGSRVPVALKVFLTAVAIVDDLGAVIIIALFYTADLEPYMLIGAATGTLALVALNVAGVRKLGAYVLVGIAIWVCVLKSGVHATLAGAVTALCVPLRTGEPGASPLKAAEHALRGWVTLGVVPVFAFANAGVALGGVSLSTFSEHVPLGIIAGLLVGKAIGVFGAGVIAIRLFGAPLPTGSTWLQLAGVAILCGIGFTMSLFIGSLAFENETAQYMTWVKLGVLAGSLLSAVAGVALLLLAAPAPPRGRDEVTK